MLAPPTLPNAWPRRRRVVPLSRTSIHIWCVRLDQTAGELSALRSLLSVEELARANRFSFSRDRDRYVARRGILRRLIEGYSGIEARLASFRTGPGGKPELVQDKSSPRLHFNLSHRESVALFAFAWDQELGIDLEPVKRFAEMESVSRHHFSPAELKALFRLDPEERLEAFYRCWTRKEAFVKAIGEGLLYPLERFDVNLAPCEPARMLAINGSAELAEGWLLEHLEPLEGFLGALAVRGRHWDISYAWYSIGR